MENYTFEKMWQDLRNGYQIYYTYVGNRYLLFKTAPNCYTQKLLSKNFSVSEIIDITGLSKEEIEKLIKA